MMFLANNNDIHKECPNCSSYMWYVKYRRVFGKIIHIWRRFECEACGYTEESEIQNKIKINR